MAKSSLDSGIVTAAGCPSINGGNLGERNTDK
jgi:hypothetical protein